MCHFGTTVSTITSSNSARRIPLGATNADGRSLGRDRHHVGPEIATHSATNRSEWREAKRKGPEEGVQRCTERIVKRFAHGAFVPINRGAQ